MKRVLSFLAIGCVAMAAFSTAALASAPPQGALTNQEYKLLVSSQGKLDQLLSGTSANWAQIRGGCRVLGTSTVLLKSERTACLATVKLWEALDDFTTQVDKCGTKSPHKYVCLASRYAGLARDTEGEYSTDEALSQAAVQRGFTGRCLNALSDTPKQLTDEQDLATATGQLAQDVKASAEIAEGQQPTTTVTLSELNSEVKLFERYTNLVLDETSPPVTVCRHK